MKKHHKLNALFLIFLLGVVGCNRGKEPPTTSEVPTTSGSTSTTEDPTSEGPSTEIVATKLEAPEVCVDNVLDIFYYEGVENASGYKLKLVDVEDDTNLVEKPFTSDDSLLPILSELEVGTYELYVKSLGDGVYYLDSDYNKTIITLLNADTPKLVTPLEYAKTKYYKKVIYETITQYVEIKGGGAVSEVAVRSIIHQNGVTKTSMFTILGFYGEAILFKGLLETSSGVYVDITLEEYFLTDELYYGTDEVPYSLADAKDAYLIEEGTTISVITNKYGGQIEGNEWGTRNEQRELVTVDSFGGNLFTLSINGDNYTYEEAIETEKVYLTTHFKLDGVELSEHLARLLKYSEVIEEYYDPLYEKYFINTYGPFLDIVWNGTSHTGRFKKALEFNGSSDGITFEVTYSFVVGTGESESRVFYESYTTGTVTYP